MQINAYAKINLTLDILGKRADGFHEVSMIMQSIDLSDELFVEKAAEGITLTIEGADLPLDRDNLIYRAAELMQKNYGIKEGVKIRLIKRIPIAAGLAGGSADAAAVFRGMNEVFSLNASVEELSKLGATVGSDIPFCIQGGTMLATGRGENLRKLSDFPKMPVVLAKPKISVSTPWAYKKYDAMPSVKHPDNIAMEAAIAQNDRERIFSLMGNVLEPVVSSEYSEIGEYEKIMLDAGARAAQMSGSGPTVFALVDDDAVAEKIASVMREKTTADVFVTQIK